MLPSIVVINDDKDSISYNPLLAKLTAHLHSLLRVYVRTSFQGETLYGIREGILFFDEAGLRQRVWRDDYDSVISEVESRLEQLPSQQKQLLKKRQTT